MTKVPRSRASNPAPSHSCRSEWVEAWRRAAPELERMRRDELRRLDSYAVIALLCGPADYTVAPRAPKPTSGLVEQQRVFQKRRP